MAHLIGSGRRRIAHVSNVLTRGADARHDTYLDSMAEAGLKPEVIGGFEDRASARKRIREYCLEFGMPDALFCHNDDVAMGVYRGLLDLGARVPDDVALVGCDGIEDGEYLEVPLTTIVQPIEEMCRIAFQLLERRIQDPASQLQQIDLYPQLVVRQSSSTANNSLMSDCNFIQRG
jgi:LacI family transcriptional regulator